jgi:hypothetical protein
MRRERTVWLTNPLFVLGGPLGETPGGYLTVEEERAAR